MEKARAIAKNTAIQVIGKGLSSLLGAATFVLLGTTLGPFGFGQYTLVMSFLAIFISLADFGFTLTVTQLISEQPEEESSIIGNILTLRTITGILFFALAPIIALFFPYESLVQIAIAIGAIASFGGTTSQMLIGIFQKNMVMHRPVIAELINRIIVLIALFFISRSGTGLLPIMWVLVAGNAAQLITVLWFARKYVQFKLQASFSIWKQIISRSWPIGLGILFNLIYLRGDVIFISILRDSPEIEIGIYGMAYKLIDVLTAIPAMYMGLILPILVAAWTQKNKVDFNVQLQNAFDFFSVTVIPVVLGSMMLGTQIFTFFVGPEYAEVGQVLLLLAPALLFVFYSGLYGHAIVGIGKQKPMTWNYFAVAVFTVLGYMIFIPNYGIYGAAVFTLLSEALITVLAYLMVKRHSGHAPKLSILGRSLAAGLIMVLVLFLLPAWNVVVLIGLGAAVYTVALGLLGGPTPATLISIFKAPQVNAK